MEISLQLSLRSEKTSRISFSYTFRLISSQPCSCPRGWINDTYDVCDQICDESVLYESSIDFSYFLIIVLIFSLSASEPACGFAGLEENKARKMTRIAIKVRRCF